MKIGENTPYRKGQNRNMEDYDDMIRTDDEDEKDFSVEVSTVMFDGIYQAQVQVSRKCEYIELNTVTQVLLLPLDAIDEVIDGLQVARDGIQQLLIEENNAGFISPTEDSDKSV